MGGWMGGSSYVYMCVEGAEVGSYVYRCVEGARAISCVYRCALRGRDSVMGQLFYILSYLPGHLC